jgi:hypothetical protein
MILPPLMHPPSLASCPSFPTIVTNGSIYAPS